MVNKRRYNSVERYTSIHLSEIEQRQQLRPMDHSPISTGEQPSNHNDLSVPMVISMKHSPSQQQQMAHPFSLMRSRRSHEQLQIPNISSEKIADFSSPALLRVPPTYDQQQKTNTAPSSASSSLRYSQQQIQYPQKSVQSFPHSQAEAFELSHPQFGRSPPQNQIDSQRPVFMPSSSQPFQPLQIRPQQSPYDLHSIQHSSVPQMDDFGRANSLPKNKIPMAVWATFSVLEVIVGIASLFVGALNSSPYNCIIEPNVPIYLIISGLFLILNGAARIFLGLSATSTKPAKRSSRQIRSERNTTTRPMLVYAVEGIGLLAILVVVILGSVWVYGASRYMHSQLYMFERHFCEHTLYWFAWWSVTIHLALFVLIILLGIIVLVYGAMPGRK